MNHIRHLIVFFGKIKTDERLHGMHVSLCMALFQYWNFNCFQNPFPVYRDNIIQLSRIGSKNTYHKCIKELHLAGYIVYHPAPSKYLPVKISIIRLDKKEPTGSSIQLELFSSNEKRIANKTSLYGPLTIDYGPTRHVPDLTATSPKIKKQQVPDLGLSIKQKNNLLNSVYHPLKIEQ
jgi:hypothetical protein